MQSRIEVTEEIIGNLVIARWKHTHVKIEFDKLRRTPARDMPQVVEHQMVAHACGIAASVGVVVGLR